MEKFLPKFYNLSYQPIWPQTKTCFQQSDQTFASQCRRQCHTPDNHTAALSSPVNLFTKPARSMMPQSAFSSKTSPSTSATSVPSPSLATVSAPSPAASSESSATNSTTSHSLSAPMDIALDPIAPSSICSVPANKSSTALSLDVRSGWMLRRHEITILINLLVLVVTLMLIRLWAIHRQLVFLLDPRPRSANVMLLSVLIKLLVLLRKIRPELSCSNLLTFTVSVVTWDSDLATRPWKILVLLYFCLVSQLTLGYQTPWSSGYETFFFSFVFRRWCKIWSSGGNL